MRNEPSEAVVDAWIALMRAQQVTLLKIERAFRDAKLPSHAWYDALWELDRAGENGLRPFEIERQMLIAQSNISRLLDRLEEKGLVQRNPCEGDGRGQVVAITKAGRDMRRKMWPVYAAAITEAVGKHVTTEDARTLAKLLGHLTARPK